MTEDDKALVERLDGWARDAFEGRKLIGGYRDILWAVERIEALSAENERLREALEWYIAEDANYMRAALGDTK